MKTLNRGFALADLVVCIACVVSLLSFFAVASAENSAHKKTQSDATQIQIIQNGFLLFAQDNKGRLPLPGLINRLPDLPSPPGLGNVPGVGPEDTSLNTTANLHAAMISQNFYKPEWAISPVERNPRVTAKKDYDYNAYAPAKDSYWDSTFKADLAQESNVSYANLVLFGTRKTDQWRQAEICAHPGAHNHAVHPADARCAMLGNRGPRDGKLDPGSFTCGPHGNWAGNVAFGDSHVEFLTATISPAHTYENQRGEQTPDNLFAFDDGDHGGDVVLSFTRKLTNDGVELQWD